MRRTVLAVAGLAIATLALAQLAKYKDWAKSPEADFLTAQERGQWSKIAADADAEKFIVAYWARRGGERFKEAIQRRIAAADEQFKMLRRRGAESSRGRIYIVLGSPTRRVQSHSAGEGPPEMSGSSGRGNFPGESPFGASPSETTETWVYEKDRFDPSWGIGELRASIVVDPQRGADSVENADEVNRVLATIAERSIVNPPSAAPGTAAAATPSTTPAAAQPAPASAATGPTRPPARPSPALAAAVLPAPARASLSAILKEKKEGSGFWGDVFRTVAGEPFYAMEFYFAGEKAPSPGAKFGGIVTDDTAGEVATFWEDATFVDRKTGPRSDKAYERSITLPAGAYHATLGIFSAEGAALAFASVSFRLERKPNDFEVSPLILTNELRALTKRPAPTDPFVFGVEKPIQIAPKADRTFSEQDSLWYFYAVANPKLSEAPAAAPTPVAPPAPGVPGPAASSPAAETKPRIMQRIGVLRNGKPAFAPFTGPAETQLLAPGYYASGSEIPLATFEPGYYTFTLNVRDLNASRDTPSFKGIDRQADFIVLKPDGSMPEKTAAKPAPAPTSKPHPKKS